MSVVGRFTIPADAFAIGDALSTVPEMQVEADRQATHSPREVFPFLWATGGDFEAFLDALEADPTVETVSVAEETDRDVLYRLTWRQEFLDLVHEMVDHHAAILEAAAQGSQWYLRLRFADESMVTSFQEHFQETGHQFEVHSLSQPTGTRQREYGLTPKQFDALVTATREGYFSIPRTATVEELGEALGISSNAVSQRIRRGCKALVESSLMTGPDQPSQE